METKSFLQKIGKTIRGIVIDFILYTLFGYAAVLFDRADQDKDEKETEEFKAKVKKCKTWNEKFEAARINVANDYSKGRLDVEKVKKYLLLHWGLLIILYIALITYLKH